MPRKAKLAAYTSSPKALKSLLLQLHLLTLQFQRIPLVLIREICGFIGNSRLLPGVQGNILKVYDLDTGEIRVKSLSIRFSIGTVFTHIDSSNCLCSGGSPANSRSYILHLQSGYIQNTRKMIIERGFSGVILHDKAVYVFGGKQHEALKACERFHLSGRRWKGLPDMNSGKYGFNPCLYAEEIYLIGVERNTCQAEAFSPFYHQFRLLSFTLQEAHIGTISLINAGEICVLMGSRRVAKGKMQAELELEVGEMWVEDRGCMVSSTTPVSVGWGCYWTHCVTGELVGFDWRTGEVIVQ